jgi:potassium-transporting ATPase KdpC subunit
VDQVRQLITQYTERADLGFLGEPRVNVLMLNVAIDQRFPM